MSKPPTQTYDDVLAFIKRYKQQHDGNSPTTREIMDGCGISSTSQVWYALNRLEALSKIELAGDGRSRQIYVTGGRWECGA